MATRQAKLTFHILILLIALIIIAHAVKEECFPGQTNSIDCKMTDPFSKQTLKYTVCKTPGAGACPKSKNDTVIACELVLNWKYPPPGICRQCAPLGHDCRVDEDCCKGDFPDPQSPGGSVPTVPFCYKKVGEPYGMCRACIGNRDVCGKLPCCDALLGDYRIKCRPMATSFGGSVVNTRCSVDPCDPGLTAMGLHRTGCKSPPAPAMYKGIVLCKCPEKNKKGHWIGGICPTKSKGMCPVKHECQKCGLDGTPCGKGKLGCCAYHTCTKGKCKYPTTCKLSHEKCQQGDKCCHKGFMCDPKRGYCAPPWLKCRKAGEFCGTSDACCGNMKCRKNADKVEKCV